MNGLDAVVVLPAAGIGDRLGSTIPKQFVDVCGKPVISYTIDSLNSISWISRIVAPIPVAWRDFANKLKMKYGYAKVEFIDGREARHESIYAGLKALSCRDSDIVIVHDAVRPFLEETFLAEVVSAAVKYGASGAIRPLVSTVIKGTSDGFMESSLVRNNFRESHTPQAFTYGLITNAYEVCSAEDFRHGTECLELVQKYCDVSPKLIDGPEYLWKVTHKKDLVLMENIIRAKNDSLDDKNSNKRKLDPNDKNGAMEEPAKKPHELINVFVGGLSENTSEETLKKFFEDNNVNPVDVRLVYKNDGRSAGFGYAHFESSDDSRRCFDLTGRDLEGYKIRFNPAEIKPAITMGSGRGRNNNNNPNLKNDTPTKLLRVKNLSIDTDTETFAAEFKGAKNICIVKNHETGISCGFGFVEYHDIAGAVEARDKMHGKEIDGQSIDIVFARAGESFGSGGRGGYSGRGRTVRSGYSSSK